MISYLHPRSLETYDLETPRWCAPDGAPLLLTPLPGLKKGQIRTGVRGLWRYQDALPFVPETPIRLGEGGTPLLPRALYGAPVALKCEWFAPTNSFKDRGTSVMLSLLRAQGIRAVLEDSSGNGGASVAAYAAAGGMDATIMTPASTSPAKTVQMRAHGANVMLVPGTRQDTADAAVAASREIFYASHNWHPFFLHGTKTLAYELWEDLGFRVPDNIIMPCGAGSNVLGCAIGFDELFRAGEIDRMPRLFAAQPANCAPIAAAFWAGAEEVAEIAVSPTIAEGTAIARPVRGWEVLRAVRQSNGKVLAIPEAAIMQATQDLARMGIYTEPTCAQTGAAFKWLLEQGVIGRDETTVLVLTGTGVKTTAAIAQMLGVAV